MKNILILAAAAALFAACGTGNKPNPMAQANDSLAQVITLKDSIINDAFNSISEIAANINQITEREKLVTTQTSAGGELTKPAKEQIADNITAISELLDKNRATIARLQASTKKLKDANVKIDALQTLVAQLQEQLNQKDAQLASLTDQVRALKIEVESLGHTVSNLEGDKTELQGTVAEQDAAIHTVYYIIGNDKELVKKDIVDKKGFIGRTRVVSDNASMTDFTKADDRNVERIPVGKAKVRIVTSHPENSYMLVKGAKDVIEELVITDKDAFWKNSKMLVISYK